MSSESCPFCGKSFKRLKTHLPHCKAAKSSKAAWSENEETKMAASFPSLPLAEPKRSQLPAKTKPSVPKPKQTRLKTSGKIKTAEERLAEASAGKTEKIHKLGSAGTGTVFVKEKVKANAKTPPKRSSETTIITEMEKDTGSTQKRTGKSAVTRKKVQDCQADKKMNDALTKKTNSIEAEDENHFKVNPKDRLWSREGDKRDDPTHEQQAKATLQDARAILGQLAQNGRLKSNAFVDKLPGFDGIQNGPNQTSRSDLETQKADGRLTERADIFKDGLRVDRLTMGLAATSYPARNVLETGVSTGPTGEEPLMKPHGPATERRGTRDGGEREARGVTVSLSHQRLGQVTLRELPDWLASCCPRRPREALQLIHRGWQWYYCRYINVRKGGVGGVAMLLAGYCVLSYVWVFPHLKRDRWRKYH